MFTRLFRAVTLALCLASAQVAAAAAAAAPPPQQLTAEQWREDLAFMVADMKRRHANLYHTVDRQTFDAAVADLHARIPTLERDEIIVGMMRIAALVGDGHTRVDPRKDAKFQFPSLPIKLYAFDDGLFIRAAKPAQASLIGARVVAIGGVPIDEAIKRVAAIISRDNPMADLVLAPLYLSMPDILHALRMSGRRDRATLTLEQGGRRRTVQLQAGEVDPLWPPDTDISLITPEGWVDATNGPTPVWLQAPLDYHRLIELPKQRAIYAQLNMVANIDGQSIGDFATKIRERAEAIKARAIILDLRLNFGGNGNLRTKLVRQLIKAEDDDTRLFVLTARGTFSASQFILDDLDRLTDAIFIGEPASSSPTSYGDAYRSIMPNSGIAIRTSIVYWQEGQNFDPWTWVDVHTPLQFADYAAGRDPALEAALTYADGRPLEDRLQQAAREGGLAGARAFVQSYITVPANRYANRKLALPRAAEMVFHKGHRDEAVPAAQAVAEAVPDSVDAWLVLAYVALETGRKDIAKSAAERAIKLDPNQRMARTLLEQATK